MENNIEDQFYKWTQQWDKALKDGVFPPSKPADPVGKSNFFGQTQVDDSELDPESKDASYWNDIAHYSESESYELLTEANKSISKKTKKIAKSSNPVDYVNLGKDSKNSTTEDWTSGDSLNELADLKKKLFDLEVKFLSKYAVGNNEKEIESVKKEMEKVAGLIDKISNKITSLRFDAEPK